MRILQGKSNRGKGEGMVNVEIYVQDYYRGCSFFPCQVLSAIKCPRQWVTPTASCSATWHSSKFFLNCHISTGHNKGQQSAAIQFRPPSAGNNNIRGKLMYTHTLVIQICFLEYDFLPRKSKNNLYSNSQIATHLVGR